MVRLFALLEGLETPIASRVAVDRRFGGARTRVGVYSEHATAEKDEVEVRYPSTLASLVIGLLEFGDVDFFHLEHRLCNAIGLLRIRITYQFTENFGNNLPR